MKRLFSSLAFVLALVAATPAFAQKSGGVRIEFQGPGGHSFGAYGRVSALHAAARTMILLQKALPAGSYQITNLTGGNSVNAIASDGLVELKLTAANAKAYDALVAAVKKAADEGARRRGAGHPIGRAGAERGGNAHLPEAPRGFVAAVRRR